jgi:hypothetical protein
MQTKPSTHSYFKVYIEDSDNSILEVKRGTKFYIYEISGNQEKLITIGEEPYRSDEEPAWDYLDRLSSESIGLIDLLSANLDYKKTIDGLNEWIQKISKPSYSYLQFDMETANLIEDYKDILKQMTLFTGDEEYAQRKSKLESFFDNYFYNRGSVEGDITLEDKEVMLAQLKQEVAFLTLLQSN